jgi:hypothetical protein
MCLIDMETIQHQNNPACDVCGSVQCKLDIHGLCPNCIKRVRIFHEKKDQEHLVFNLSAIAKNHARS